MKKILNLCCIIGVSGAVVADQILFKDSVDSWQVGNVKIVADKTCSVAGSVVLESKDLINIKPDMKYRLSGEFKSLSKKKGKFFFGVVPYDKKKKQISMIEVNPVYKSGTVLVDACKKGDKILKVKNALNWKVSNYGAVAFKADKALKDLPNRNLSSRGIVKLEKMDDYWIVVLKKPCGKDFPAGTEIRQHLSGSNYIYCGAFADTPSDSWRKKVGNIAGIATRGSNGNRKMFWPGTAYVKVLLYANYFCSKKVVLGFKDIKFEEVNK
jgi:hypothetical protein